MILLKELLPSTSMTTAQPGVVSSVGAPVKQLTGDVAKKAEELTRRIKSEDDKIKDADAKAAPFAIKKANAQRTKSKLEAEKSKLTTEGVIVESDGYCPKCKSRLFPADDDYMEKAGVCSACVTWDKTPDRRFKQKYEDALNKMPKGGPSPHRLNESSKGYHWQLQKTANPGQSLIQKIVPGEKWPVVSLQIPTEDGQELIDCFNKVNNIQSEPKTKASGWGQS